MLGLSIDKIVVLLIVAVFVVGPERMPKYAAQLARLVRSLRSMAEGAKDRLRDEMGPGFDDVDWKKLDPRQYDPRRIIRSALLDDSPAVAVALPVVGIVKPIALDEEQAVDVAPEPAVHTTTLEGGGSQEPAVTRDMPLAVPREGDRPDARPEPDFEPQVDGSAGVPTDALSHAFRFTGG